MTILGLERTFCLRGRSSLPGGRSSLQDPVSPSSGWKYLGGLGAEPPTGRICKANSKVLYLRPLVQGCISVSPGSWFSPRSALPPHNGVGDGMPPKGPLRGRLSSGASTFDGEVIRPPSRWDVCTPGRAYSVGGYLMKAAPLWSRRRSCRHAKCGS